MARYIDKALLHEVESDFSDELIVTKGDFDEALKNVLDSYEEVFSFDDRDELPIWLGITLALWKYGKLEEDFREKSMAIILKHYEELLECGTKADINYLEVKIQKIQTKNEKPKKFKLQNKTFYRCKWNIGDVYAYRFLNSKTNTEQYAYMLKVGNFSDARCMHPDVLLYDILSSELLSFDEVVAYSFKKSTYLKNNVCFTYDMPISLLGGYQHELPESRLSFLGNVPDIEAQLPKYVTCVGWYRLDEELNRIFNEEL